jgi:formate dehydrogenase maturation protein FdhE
MVKTRRVGLGLAAVLGIMIATPVSADEACQRALATINRAQATLTQIAQLIDGIKAHQTADADQPYKCPACGMMMPTHPTGSLTRAVKYNGKTYYCCTGCDMSATADKD